MATPAVAVRRDERAVGLDGQLLHRRRAALERRVGLLVGRLGQHQQELVGAVAADQVAAAQLRGERGGPVPQHLVAALAAGLLVDALEVVEVEHGEGHLAPVALGARQLERGALAQVSGS